MKRNIMAFIAIASIACLMTGCMIFRKAPSCQSVNVDGVNYSLSPCVINETFVEGSPTKTLETMIIQDKYVGYGFSVYGYGNGFPTYAMISDVSSGSTRGSQYVNFKISSSVLHADGNKPRIYKGYIPIHIYQGSETGYDTNFVKLYVTLKVLPKKK